MANISGRFDNENIVKTIQVDAEGLHRVFDGGEAINVTGTATVNDVTFYDYDGSILYSYTADEFLALSSMPEDPTHEGLISLGWNWDFTNARLYVADYGKLNIGEMYAPEDGKTHIKIHIPEGGRTEIPLCFTQSVANGVIVNWGDGSNTETSDVIVTNGSVEIHHTYEEDNTDYEITLETTNSCEIGYGYKAKNGRISLLGGSDTENAVFQVFPTYITELIISDSVTSIESGAFSNCTHLQSLIIPDSITSIGDGAFVGCYDLQSLTVPSSITSINASIFDGCRSLQSLILSDSITSIGAFAFSLCRSLRSLSIPNLVTSIEDNAFESCEYLQTLIIPHSVRSIGDGAFSNCNTLRSLTIPNSITSIEANTFTYCDHLEYLQLPDSITSIGDAAFTGCCTLQSFTLPSSITSIGDEAFAYCEQLFQCTLLSTVPPTLGTNAFQNLHPDAKFLVPAGTYDTYVAAEDWLPYADYIITNPGDTTPPPDSPGGK